MALEVHVLPHAGTLPTLRWKRDAETGILSGSMRVTSSSSGYTGTVELHDDDGSTAVLDIASGLLCGIDIVVWPEFITLPGLAAPVDATQGQVMVPSRSARRGVSALEFDTTLSLAADPAVTTLHMRIGIRRPVDAIRVADCFVIEVDNAQRLAGFWLEGLPRDDIAPLHNDTTP